MVCPNDASGLPFARGSFDERDTPWTKAPYRAIADLDFHFAGQMEEDLAARFGMPIFIPTGWATKERQLGRWGKW